MPKEFFVEDLEKRSCRRHYPQEELWEPVDMLQKYAQEWILIDWYYGEVVACNSTRAHIHPGVRLFNYLTLSESTLNELKSMLSSPIKEPVLFSHSKLLWLMLPHFYLSSGCVLFGHIQVPPRVLYAFFTNSGTPIHVTREARRDIKPLGRSLEDAYLAVDIWWNELHNCLPRKEICQKYDDLSGEVVRLMYALSNLFSVPLHIKHVHPSVPSFPLPSEFDLYQFTVYTAIIFQLAVRLANDEGISAAIETMSENLYVRYSFESTPQGARAAERSTEIKLCERIADRYWQLFDFYVEENRFHINFCTNRKDFSRWGVKQLDFPLR